MRPVTANLPLSLNSLPVEVLRTILSVTSIGNLSGLLSQDGASVLSSLHVLKEVIVQKFQNSCLTLHHAMDRHQYERPSHFGDSPLDCGYENVHYFYTPEDFRVIDGFCSREGLNVESRIHYEIHNDSDFLNYLDLLTNLEQTKGTKLKVYAKVKTYYTATMRNNMDLTQPYNLMHGLFERLTRISINFEPLVSTEKVLDLSIFANVEALHLHYCNVKGSFASCRKLKELLFHPTICFDLNLFELPLSLKNLALDSDHIRVARKRKRKDSPKVQYPLIDRLCLLTYNWKCLCKSAEVILSTLVHKKMRSIEINIPRKALCEINTCIGAIQKLLIKKEVRLTSFVLNGLEEYGRYCETNNDKLEGPQLWSPTTKLLSSLQELVLHATSLTTTTPLLNSASSNLRYLSLSSSKSINWAVSTKDFSKFTNMKQLNLKWCKIGNFIDQFVFPDSLEMLDLSGNDIKFVDNVNFPLRLSNLNLDHNKIKSLTAPPLPQSLKSLSVQTKGIQECDLSVNKFGENLQIELLYLDSFIWENKELSKHYKLPEMLWSLSLTVVKFTLHSYPNTLANLYLERCDFSEQDVIDLTCCPKLKFLDFTICDLRDCEFRLPYYLEEVGLFYNETRGFPTEVGGLKCLKKVSFRGCFSKSVIIDFSSTVLELIDFASSGIEEISLSFPGPTTSLRKLILGGNPLKDFTMEALGHNNGCSHEKLQEIDLRSIELTEERISELKTEVPASVKLLWVTPNPSKKDVLNAMCGNLFCAETKMEPTVGSCVTRETFYEEVKYPPLFDIGY